MAYLLCKAQKHMHVEDIISVRQESFAVNQLEKREANSTKIVAQPDPKKKNATKLE